MRKTFIILFLISCIMVFAQDKKPLVVEEMLEITKIEESVPLIVNSIMGSFKQKRPDIPDTYWKMIEDEVDINIFLNGARQLYNQNYTVSELEELVFLYKSGDMDLFKQKSERIAPQLYQIGNDFGRKTVQFISQKIKEYEG